MKFLHAADLHIDSALKGLGRRADAPVAAIRRAPREAFRRLVNLALAEQVDFVVLAGDVFDSKWKDIATGTFFVNELHRLAPNHLAPIPVYVVLGNHDHAGSITSTLRWPEHVHRFSAAQAETKYVPGLNVAIHGQSFARREVPEDLAAGYPDAIIGFRNIGVLHTSLEGYTQHATYAPTSQATLVSKGYDAWCLGHIHTPLVLRKSPLILYPGNIQGRHVNECGPRGCYIIDDASGQLEEMFHPLDSFRWERLEIDVSSLETYEEVLAHITDRIDTMALKHENRRLCMRITLEGATKTNATLRSQEEDLHGEISVRLHRHQEGWLESLRIRTTPRLNIAEARSQGGLVGDIFSALEEARSESEIQTKLLAALRNVQVKIPATVVAEYGTKLTEGAGFLSVIEEAELLLCGMLAS